MRSQKGKVTLKKEYKRESTILSIIPPEVGSSSFMVLFTFVTIVTQILIGQSLVDFNFPCNRRSIRITHTIAIQIQIG